MKAVLIRFLKAYCVFLLFALLVNLSMEMLIPTPESASKEAGGIAMFYAIFSLFWSAAFLLSRWDAARMGLLSLAAGFILEFAAMRPDWVMKIYSLSAGPAEIGAVLVSALYWFMAWGVPAYVLGRFVLKEKRN